MILNLFPPQRQEVCPGPHPSPWLKAKNSHPLVSALPLRLSLADRLSLPPITPSSSNIDVDAVRMLRGPPTTLSRLPYHPILPIPTTPILVRR